MAQHGGYRKPSKPAPTSGPGALSQRTDGGPQPMRDLPNAGYGEQQQFQQDQAAGPMQGSGPAGGGGPGAAGPPGGPVEVTPFGAPSMRPQEPVTAGADRGPGVSSAALGIQPLDQKLQAEDVERLRSALPYLSWVASQPGASESMRIYVRKIRGMLP